MLTHTMTGKDVAILVRMAKSTKQRTAMETQVVLKFTALRLAQAAEGKLELAPDVRITLPNVVQIAWKLRKNALARQKELKTQREATAVAQALEAEAEAPSIPLTSADIDAALDALFV